MLAKKVQSFPGDSDGQDKPEEYTDTDNSNKGEGSEGDRGMDKEKVESIPIDVASEEWNKFVENEGAAAVGGAGAAGHAAGAAGDAVDAGDGAAGVDAQAFAELQSGLQESEREKQELTDRLLRLQADFDNYRKRMRMEKEMLEEYANFALIQKLLPVLDNLERASAAAVAVSPDSALGEGKSNLVEGIALIFRQFTEILGKEGVLPMAPTGKPFDPNFHEAVMQEQSPDHEPGIVLDEVQKGYMIKDKVLRASMVKVSCE